MTLFNHCKTSLDRLEMGEQELVTESLRVLIKHLFRLGDVLGTVPVDVTSVESVQMSTGEPQSSEPDKTTEINASNTNPLITDKQMEDEEVKYKLFPDQLTWG